MVRPRCIVSYCNNKGRHKFPKDEARREQWIQAIKHVKPTAIGPYSGVCSDHFSLSDFSIIPSYWNNYHPARTLKKSAVPSVFDWNKEVQDEPTEEQPCEEAPSFDSALLYVQVEEPSSSNQEAVSFNPARVKATYSRGQTIKSQKTTSYSRLKPNKRSANETTVKIEKDSKFLPPATINNGEKRLKISGTSLPPNIIIKSETAITDDISANKGESILTPCLAPEVIIKTEQEEETLNETMDGNRLTSPHFLTSPHLEVKIKTEPEEVSSMIEVEIEMLETIKQENNEDMSDL